MEFIDNIATAMKQIKEGKGMTYEEVFNLLDTYRT